MRYRHAFDGVRVMKSLWFALCVTAAMTVATAANAEQADNVQVRLCPPTQMRAYPLDEQGRLKSLQISGIAIINRGSSAFVIERITISLLDHGRALDARTLEAPEIARWVGNGPPLLRAMRSTGFEFCGDALAPADVSAGGRTLNHDETLLVVNQVFAYDHTRDAALVAVDGSIDGRRVTLRATIPISEQIGARLRFPLRGVWYVGWGPSFHTGHRAHIFEEFALDIAKLGGEGVTHRGAGLRFEDYYAYGAPVLAAAAGRVVHVEANQAENRSALQRPDETAEAYNTRHSAEASEEMASRGPDWVLGNYVVIDHGEGEYSVYAHLQPGSLRVRAGDAVRSGDVLGKLGSSGNSTEPHLHFQVCDRPEPLSCAGVPVQFSNITLLWSDLRAVQSGDIVTAR